MKVVEIFSRGSMFPGSGFGYYEYWLVCEGHVRYGWGSEKNLASATSYTVLGLLDAVRRINKPCHVVLITKGPVGFVNIKRSKSAKQLTEILDTLMAKQCTYEIESSPELGGARERELFRWCADNHMARPNRSDVWNNLMQKQAGIGHV